MPSWRQPLHRAGGNTVRRINVREATMDDTQAFENRVLESLNASKTVRSFMLMAVELLAEAVSLLMLQAFRKDDYAVKYAVEPLLSGSGPLGELSVRLKLIYGLGMISRKEYEDTELLMALGEELAHDEHAYRFTDDEILGPISELHCVSSLPPSPIPPSGVDPDDALLAAMQQQRYQQMVRSTLVLSLTELIAGISLKKAF
ncbi:MltR family transcriptional regulator [Dickeya chrysanthemi]|uniref:Mannitol repressor, MtlR n=3 Tax=Pectobacteriaceae TaxID=1903410 RepID=C6CFW4_DICC1|nr:MltR family transcriptional regulator [Dickeya chrysanthemi]ACT04947.1 mannitol repressor, MtlR [Dickeya chrysanthemi Ech1591]MBX9445494.1 MltR family transcriptional regulator [Dickeya chrysanthemi]MCA7009105.1 MltR family transcriptional regulator [Dickeya chrysanthemi]WJM85630.1 MltR family transcriptional regulator [Dickeya chrysanthemi]